jgi:hypothetical protein
MKNGPGCNKQPRPDPKTVIVIIAPCPKSGLKGSGPANRPEVEESWLGFPLRRKGGQSVERTGGLLQAGQTSAPFDYSGPLTENVILGCLATRFPKTTLEWDERNLKVTTSRGSQRLRAGQASRRKSGVEGLLAVASAHVVPTPRRSPVGRMHRRRTGDISPSGR